VALLNFSSSANDLSAYVLKELALALEKSGSSVVLARQDIDRALAQTNLRASGEVSDAVAVQIGKTLGVQFVVTGSLEKTGDNYRFRTRLISVSDGAVQAVTTINVIENPHLRQLLGIATSVSVPAPVPAPIPAPVLQGSTDRPGLYVNGAYQGQMDLLDAVDYIKLNAKNDNTYIIVLGKDEKAPYITFTFNNLKLGITLKTAGTERRVSYDGTRPAYSLFTVGTGVTFTLEEGVTLTGLASNSKSLVRVEGGTFIMNGGSIRDNKPSESGGGVQVASGTFIMNNGTINGNSLSGSGNDGGGVYVNRGTFTMNNGIISGNTSSFRGGGIYIDQQGTFNMTGGTISRNSSSNGGGVCVNTNGTFTKSGTAGIIYGSNAEGDSNTASNGPAVYVYSGSKKRNTTARVSQALDSGKSGTAGGWE
jgi:hypothetical protein